jgi:hypothetical protein
VVNPWNGPLPSFQAIQSTFCSVNFVAGCTRRAVGQTLAPPNAHFPYSYQGSIGFQQQIGETTSVTADYAYTGLRNDRVTGYNVNLSYNPTTGLPIPFANVAARPYPDWNQVLMDNFGGWANTHSLQTSWTKRMSNHFQGSATYTLAGYWRGTPAPWSGVLGTPFGAGGPLPFPVAAPFSAQYGLGVNDQRHRAVFNGIWDAGHGFQLSGLYFFGSGQRLETTWGTNTDSLNTGGTVGSNRVRPDGSIVPLNGFVGSPIHRVDLRLQRRFRLTSQVSVDGLVELFNVFNHANYGSYTTQQSNPKYGQPSSNLNVAYQPRMMQLGFRLAF